MCSECSDRHFRAAAKAADALPFDSGFAGQNPELVGFLLHPVSRSETWRRLMFLQVSSPRAPGAKPKFWVTLPGGRVDLEDANQRIDNAKIILDLGGFLKGWTS